MDYMCSILPVYICTCDLEPFSKYAAAAAAGHMYLQLLIYVTGPAKMVQVGTQNLTIFFNFAAS